jgi:hypothetical protein
MAHGALRAGWRVLWLRQRILWWVFAVNVAVAWAASAPLNARWRPVLDHSLAADQLFHGFNLPRYIELTSLPQIGFGSAVPSLTLAAAMFFAFMLFITGGILHDYASDHKLSTGEFFHAAGAFVWRFVRLLVMMLIVLAPVAMAAAGINKWSGHLSSDSPRERLGFWVDVAGLALVLFVAICIRIWFDIAQVHAVITGERASSRAAGRALRITWVNFGRLFTIYIVPSVLAWTGSTLIILVWTRVPGHLVSATLVLGELWMLIWLAARLWQRAGEVCWYQSNVGAPPQPAADSAVEVAVAQPARMPV